MKIAVASNGLEVSPHFECCVNYNFFTIDQGMVMDYRNFPILSQQDLSKIDILDELGIDVLIVGCLSNENRTDIQSRGIEVVCGANGDAKAVVEDYLSEEFVENDSYCDRYRCVYGEDTPCEKSLLDAKQKNILVAQLKSHFV